MKIAIIGAGNVGAALGKGWSRGGHEVVYGVRDPRSESAQDAVEGTLGRARAAHPAEAVKGADVIVLATPYPVAAEAVRSLGGIEGRILVDCTNPLEADLSGLSIGRTTSAAEEIARAAPGARVVKAFNTVGSGIMADASFPGAGAVKPLMPVCGDDADAKAPVLELARELGFDALDAGALRVARLLEPVAMLWIHLAYKGKLGTNHAFALLRRG